MKKSNLIRFTIYLVILASLLPGCYRAADLQRILFINSYHNGYPSSDAVLQGFMDSIGGEQVVMKVFFLDTKNHPEPERVEAKVKEALTMIERFDPRLIIASDDNAVAKVVVPHLQETGIPIIFTGVNWSADAYGLQKNVTGILEVSPLRKSIETFMELDSTIGSIAILSENTPSERKNKQLLDTLYHNLGLEVDYHMVDDFATWKDRFLECQASSDILYAPTNGAIRNWDREEAITFAKEHTRIPTFTNDDFMMDYCVLGHTRVDREQGEWVAMVVKGILKGASPADFPMARTQQTHTFLNVELAEKIGFTLPAESSETVTLYTYPDPEDH